MDALEKLLNQKFERKTIILVYSFILLFPVLMQLDLLVFGNSAQGVALEQDYIHTTSRSYGRRSRLESIPVTYIVFKDQNNRNQIAESGWYDTYDEGEEVTVFYSDSDPEKTLTLSLSDFYLNPIGIVTFIALFIFSMLVLSQNMSSGPPNRNNSNSNYRNGNSATQRIFRTNQRVVRK